MDIELVQVLYGTIRCDRPSHDERLHAVRGMYRLRVLRCTIRARGQR